MQMSYPFEKLFHQALDVLAFKSDFAVYYAVEIVIDKLEYQVYWPSVLVLLMSYNKWNLKTIAVLTLWYDYVFEFDDVLMVKGFEDLNLSESRNRELILS